MPRLGYREYGMFRQGFFEREQIFFGMKVAFI
jgi:hypothetical protein